MVPWNEIWPSAIVLKVGPCPLSCHCQAVTVCHSMIAVGISDSVLSVEPDGKIRSALRTRTGKREIENRKSSL